MGILIILVALLITRIPIVGEPFRVLNTLVHELGHLVATKLVRGETTSIELQSDASGVAYSKVRGSFGAFVVTIAGYPFSSLVSLILVYLVGIEKYIVVFYLLIFTVGVSLLIWVRNGFGAIWSIGFIVLTVIIYTKAGEGFFEYYITFLVAVLYIEALYFTVILLVQLHRGNDTGDATTLEELTGISQGFWVYLFFLTSLAMFLYGIKFW